MRDRQTTHAGAARRLDTFRRTLDHEALARLYRVAIAEQKSDASKSCKEEIRCGPCGVDFGGSQNVQEMRSEVSFAKRPCGATIGGVSHCDQRKAIGAGANERTGSQARGAVRGNDAVASEEDGSDHGMQKKTPGLRRRRGAESGRGFIGGGGRGSGRPRAAVGEHLPRRGHFRWSCPVRCGLRSALAGRCRVPPRSRFLL